MADDLIIAPGPSNGKSFFLDTTKCTGCRACQVACKQWNQLEAESTTNRGTYENPPDLSANTKVKIRYKETERSDGSVAWTFVRNSCRHCVNPPCKEAAVNPDSITIDAQTGAVIYNEGTKDESYAKIRLACPFDIPRQAPDGQLHKCLMCTDRVHNGEFPACAKTCTAGGLKFGDREEVLAMADARVAELSTEFPNARILDRRDVRLLILVTDPADFYALMTRD